MSTKRQRNLWRFGFLTVTVLALIMECAAAWDGNPNTDPWTDLITTYIPWQVALAIFGALVLWVPTHFIVAYRRRAKRNLQRAQDEQAARAERERQDNLPFTYDENGARIWKDGSDPGQPTLF